MRRVCTVIWRRGELIGVRFVSARELRQGTSPAAPPAGEPDKTVRKVRA